MGGADPTALPWKGQVSAVHTESSDAWGPQPTGQAPATVTAAHSTPTGHPQSLRTGAAQVPVGSVVASHACPGPQTRASPALHNLETHPERKPF